MMIKSNERQIRLSKPPICPREVNPDAFVRQAGIYVVMSEEIRRGVFQEGNSQTKRAPSLSALDNKK